MLFLVSPVDRMNWVLGFDQWSRCDLRNKWCSRLPCASYPQCVSFWQEDWSSLKCSAWELLPTVAVCVATGWKLSLCVVFHDPTALTEAVVFWVLEVCSALAWSPGCCCSGFSGSFLVTGLGFLEPIRGGTLFSFWEPTMEATKYMERDFLEYSGGILVSLAWLIYEFNRLPFFFIMTC